MRALTLISKADYCEYKAQELISEAQASNSDDHYDLCVIRAIRLLVIARSLRQRKGFPDGTKTD